MKTVVAWLRSQYYRVVGAPDSYAEVYGAQWAIARRHRQMRSFLVDPIDLYLHKSIPDAKVDG